MRLIMSIILVLMGSIMSPSFAQNIQEKFVIKLNDSGKSNNNKVPLIFSIQEKSLDTLYLFDGKYATKEVLKFKKSNRLTSLKDFLEDLEYLNLFPENKMFVDVVVRGNQLELLPRENRLVQKIGNLNKISLDITKGIILRKESLKFSALTIPFKAYLSSNSDSLVNFTNNIETNVNIAVSFGKIWENHSFKVNQESKLRSHHYLFGLIGANKLKLNEKNTDNSEKISDDVILSISTGLGYQVGFDKLGLSIILGIDTPISELGKEWIFKRKLWLGIGFGYSIFK